MQAPSELARREKLHFKIRETLQQQVEEDEALIECISGTRGKFGGAYYLGLSNKHFLISELDMFSNPLYTMQVHFSAIEHVQIKGTVIENILVVRIRGEKVKKFEIPNLFKDQLFSIVKFIEEETA